MESKFIEASAFLLKTQVEIAEEKAMNNDPVYHVFLDGFLTLLEKCLDECEPHLYLQDNSAAYVVEVCPNCESEVEMRWEPKQDGYKAFCPYCGGRLMLCDECLHAEGGGDCDYCTATDTCKHNKGES